MVLCWFVVLVAACWHPLFAGGQTGSVWPNAAWPAPLPRVFTWGVRLTCHIAANSALPLSLPLGWLQVVSHVVIGLKTVKGTKQLKLDPTIYDSLQASLCVCF